MIDERDTQALLRHLCGESSPEERRGLEARLAAEPELREADARLRQDWDGLDLPPASVPGGFSAGVMERISGVPPAIPVWTRLAAAAALVVGIAAGVEIGRLPAEEGLAEALAGPSALTLADRYLAALAELDRGVDE